MTPAWVPGRFSLFCMAQLETSGNAASHRQVKSRRSQKPKRIFISQHE